MFGPQCVSTPYLLKKTTVNITDKLEDRIFQSEHNNFPHPFVLPYPGYITRKDPLPNIYKKFKFVCEFT